MFLKFVIPILTLIVGVSGSYETFKNWNTLTKFQKSIIIISILLLVLVFIDAIVELINKNRKEKIEATTGELKGLNASRIRIGVIGQSSFLFTPGGNSFEFFDPYTQKNWISAKIIDGKLKINFLIHGEDKNLAAGIQDNYWVVFDKKYDYNNDDSAFEIVTPIERKVLFQVQIENGDIRMAGLLRDVDGAGLYFCNNPSGNSMTTANTVDNFALPGDKIKRLFKYPREKNLGERDL